MTTRRESAEEKSSSSRHVKSHREKRERSSRSEKHHDKSTHRRRSRSKSNHKCQEFMLMFLRGFLFVLHLLIDLIVEQFFKWYWGPKKTCPPLSGDMQFLAKSGTELAAMIRNKEITCVKVVQGYIDRIKEVNPLVNAVVDGPFSAEALEEAKSIDERIARGQISEDEFAEKPFLGVPFTTKDSTSCKGKLHTLGLLSRKNTTSIDDAECIHLVKKAGGILIATTNVPEVNRWQETRNNVVGQTNNPYDLRRTVGGSSGGEAALLAACGTGIGTGTDIGGSIRMPAFFCGVFGHKPTMGVVDTRGCTFRTGKEPTTMVVAGPMTRHVDDLMPLFKVMAGPRNVAALKLDEPVDVKKLRYFFIQESGELRCSSVSGDLKRAMADVRNYLAQITNEPVQELSLPGIEKTINMWRYWMTKEPADYSCLLGNGVKLNPLLELGKYFIGKSEFTLAAIYSLIDGILPQENAEKIKSLTEKCRDEFNAVLGDDGVLIYPSYTHPAPFHYSALINLYNFSHFCLGNILHVPATQVPLGLNKDGVPLGVQVIATANRDRDTIAVAAEITKQFKGWVPLS